MNGAVTIGTLDGANIEIRDRVGAENFFVFGLTAEEVAQLKAKGYKPWEYYNSNFELKQAIDQIACGYFGGDANLFQPLVDALKNSDDFMLFADYQSYIECQQKVSQVYSQRQKWIEMSILNTARVGYFSSDRTIREYARDIWNVHPVAVSLDETEQTIVKVKQAQVTV